MYFVSAGFTAIAILFCVTINIMLKGRKMTDLTKYIESSDDLQHKNELYDGVNVTTIDYPYRNTIGVTSF